MSTFEIGTTDFLLDGRPLRIISGALHYFRIHPAQWGDRIRTARQLGLNTIETYVAWNFHSRRPGEFCLDGWRDLGRFLDLVDSHGMHAIVRPGPYICAEWTNAGLPPWLTAQPGIALRSSDPAYLAACADFYRAVLPTIASRQVTRGGNVLMVQVENEYGAFGDDPGYLRSLVELVRAQDIEVPLFTCDQADDEMLARGGLPELLRTATFGSRSRERLEILRRHQPTGPLMCGEFWDGWFDSRGRHHHLTDVRRSARDLDELLGAGASVNLYLAHGGTNFGFTNGANHKGTYAPIVTSYDYDAPIREDGSPGPKFDAFRQVIGRHAPVPAEHPATVPPAPRFCVELRRPPAPDDLPTGPDASLDHLPTMDEIDPGAIVALYETDIRADDEVLVLDGVRDHATAFVNGRRIGELDRQRHRRALPLPGVAGTLRLLVEDLGRVNYGPRLGEPKGLIGPASTARRRLTDWRVSVVDVAAIPGRVDHASAAAATGALAGPVVLSGRFDTEPGRDLFLDTSGWQRGVAWLNDFCLGRYDCAGPTRTLYVPGPLVRATGNSLVVWELDACPEPVARFVAGPALGHTEE